MAPLRSTLVSISLAEMFTVLFEEIQTQQSQFDDVTIGKTKQSEKVCARASDSHHHCRCFQHQMENMRDTHCHK